MSDEPIKAPVTKPPTSERIWTTSELKDRPVHPVTLIFWMLLVNTLGIVIGVVLSSAIESHIHKVPLTDALWEESWHNEEE